MAAPFISGKAGITGYGQDGPYAQRAGHDMNYLGLVGLLGLTGARDGPPVQSAGQIADLGGGGLMAAFGVMAALHERRSSGEGQMVDVSMADGALSWLAMACMANTAPVNDSRLVTAYILAEAARHGYARVYPVGSVTPGMAGERLADLAEMVEAGAVALSDDGLPVANAGLMRRALQYARQLGVPVTQHAEDLDLTGPGVMHEGEWATRLGLPGIPGSAEDVVVARDLILAEDAGGRYHVAHLSTARSLELVRRARAAGLGVTCEVTPHHLVLTDQAVHDSGCDSDTKMKPPLRSEADREALVAGLVDGTVDAIASDHAPHAPGEKANPFSCAPFGILGLETTLPLCLDHLVRPGTITLSRLVDLLSAGPARCYSLPGGSLAEGRPADVTLFDPDAPVTIDRSGFHSRSRNTPFDGWKLHGRVHGTWLGGRRVVV